MKEIEVKLRISDVVQTRRRLLEAGFEPEGERVFEENWLYDFPTQTLRQSRSLLRLRKSGDRAIITFKDPPEGNLRYKMRDEIQTEVAEAEVMRDIFRKLGLNETFRYQKYRTAFRIRDESRGHVLLDETPIGPFLELEGATDWIDQAASQLGFSPGDYILKSYVTLFRESCPEQEFEGSAMLFGSTYSQPNPKG
ncbi:MAG: class IV adenylate cyclase [Acidobacteriia bacterium]|nr:class IV adenylate cyclase [Terriglobia bacterium]